MLKKILILPVGFLITTFLYISCCKCLDPKGNFYEVTRATVSPLGSGRVLVDNGLPVTADTVFLNYYLGVNCIAEAKPDLSFLVNNAYACSCGCGEQGLKSKLVSIEVTSDNTFNGIPANNSLNAFFKVKNDNSNLPDYSIDSLVTLFNGPDTGIRAGFFLFTKTKPGNTFNYKFTMNMTYANSTIVTVVTNPIKWQ